MKNKKRIRTLSVLVFVVALLLSGLSLAYFTQRDEVTNRIQSRGYAIQLFEQNWVIAGDSDAEKMEPGDIIAKDPYTLNESVDEVYVRMRLVVVADDVNITDTEQGKYILSSLKLNKTTKLSEETEALLKLKDDDMPVAGEDKMLGTLFEQTGAARYVSQNPDFYYYESTSGTGSSEKVRGWFYYGTTSADAFSLKALPGKERTPNLFEEITIPILKSEYYGNFDKPFLIYVIAEGVPVEKETLEDGSQKIVEKTFEEIVNEFDSKYGVYPFDK